MSQDFWINILGSKNLYGKKYGWDIPMKIINDSNRNDHFLL